MTAAPTAAAAPAYAITVRSSIHITNSRQQPAATATVR